MKKLLLTIALAAAGLGGLVSSAQAHDHHCGGWNWGGCGYDGPYCGGYWDGCGHYDGDGYYYRHNDHDHDHDHDHHSGNRR